jgi:surfeit locus 1 family protein
VSEPRPFPVLATVVAALAVLAMLALGFWQLAVRLPEKEAYLARLAANPARPPIAWPRQPGDDLLFRRASATCLAPVSIVLAGAGAQGFRAIARCRTGADGPGLSVQLGTTRDPKARPAWRGGAVSGTVAHAPSDRSLIGGLVDRRAPEFMLVADPPLAGLGPNRAPDLASVPNNHLAYAGQWFFFAGVAATIYAIALRRRLTGR